MKLTKQELEIIKGDHDQDIVDINNVYIRTVLLFIEQYIAILDCCLSTPFYAAWLKVLFQ